MARWWLFGAAKPPASRASRGAAEPSAGTHKISLAEGAKIAEKAEKKNFFGFLRGLRALFISKPSNEAATKALGRRGEDLACRLLKKARLKILARNYRCPGGEIDIIALDTSTRRNGKPETIVFVEVKTRSTETPAGPESAVDAHKRKQVTKAARYYLRHHPTKGYSTRYDVVAVVIEPGQKPAIRHIPNAF